MGPPYRPRRSAGSNNSLHRFASRLRGWPCLQAPLVGTPRGTTPRGTTPRGNTPHGTVVAGKDPGASETLQPRPAPTGRHPEGRNFRSLSLEAGVRFCAVRKHGFLGTHDFFGSCSLISNRFKTCVAQQDLAAHVAIKITSGWLPAQSPVPQSLSPRVPTIKVATSSR